MRPSGLRGLLAPRLVPGVLGLALLAACGKKLPPEPPVLVLPARPQPVALTQEGSDVVLRFPYPTKTSTGLPLTALTKVTVWREVIGAPPTAQLPVAATKPGDREREERLFLQRAEKRLELTPRDLDERTYGSELVVRDSLRDLFEARRLGKAILRYAVSVTRDRRRTSDLSPLVAIRPLAPPDAPFNLSADSEEGRVCLGWEPPPVSEDGTRPAAKGYAVYRRPAPPPGTADEGWYEGMLGGTLFNSFVDTTVETGKRYVYVVRAAPAVEPPYVLGPPSEEIVVDTRDVFPPPAPEGLLVLREIGGVRLLWNPVLSADLAGYEVSRRVGSGPWVTLAKGLSDPTYFDATAPEGAAEYGVLAFDKAGNLGPRTAAAAPAAGEGERR